MNPSPSQKKQKKTCFSLAQSQFFDEGMFFEKLNCALLIFYVHRNEDSRDHNPTFDFSVIPFHLIYLN